MSCQYSKKELISAGKSLSGKLFWNDENQEDIVRIFEIAHDWRISHAKPMTSVLMSLDAQRRSNKLDGMTVSRLKRMTSIRKNYHVQL